MKLNGTGRACVLLWFAIVVVGVSGCGSSNIADVLLLQVNAAVTTALDNFITFLANDLVDAIPDA